MGVISRHLKGLAHTNRWLPLLIVKDIVIWAISGYVQMCGLMEGGHSSKTELTEKGRRGRGEIWEVEDGCGLKLGEDCFHLRLTSRK